MKVTFDDQSDEFISKLKSSFLRAVFNCERNAVMFAPAGKTGQLRMRINVKEVSDFHYEIWDGTNYGVFVEYGTMPHSIDPVNKKALAFETGWTYNPVLGIKKYGGGNKVVVKHVEHPGSVMHPFMRPAYDIFRLDCRRLMNVI